MPTLTPAVVRGLLADHGPEAQVEDVLHAAILTVTRIVLSLQVSMARLDRESR